AWLLARQLLEREGQGPRAEDRVVQGRELVRVVAAAGRADEEHPGRHARELRVLGVVTGAGEELGGIDADLLRGPEEQVAELRIERHGGDAREHVDRGPCAPRVAD